MNLIATTLMTGFALLASNSSNPSAQTLLRAAQKAYPTAPYCQAIPMIAAQIVGHQLEISHYQRMSRDFKWQPAVQAGLITIVRKPGEKEDSLGDYTEIVTPSKKMIQIASDVQQPGGRVICIGDRKITAITDIQKPRNGIVRAKAVYSFTPRAWNTPAMTKLFHLDTPPKSVEIAFHQMQDNSWQVDEESF